MSGPFYVFDKVCKGDTMRKFSSQAVVLVLIAGLSVTLVGCGRIAMLQGLMSFRDGNALYGGQDWKAAAAKYEDTVAKCGGASDAICKDPTLSVAYFFLGNSYDNLYQPSRNGEANNDALMTKAIANYRKAAEVVQDQKIKTLALQYLVAAYGPDKLNDPAEAEPLVQQLIQMDSKEPANYFQLAQIYEGSGDYEQAEAALIRARDAKPTDPAVYTTLAGYYNRQGEFEKTIGALQARAEQEPNNPEAYYTIATYYWDKAYRDFRLPAVAKLKYVESGVGAIDKAISLNKDYIEAIVYKNLLLRLQANLERAPARQQALLKEADQLRDHAEELRKKKAAGTLGS